MAEYGLLSLLFAFQDSGIISYNPNEFKTIGITQQKVIGFKNSSDLLLVLKYVSVRELTNI